MTMAWYLAIDFGTSDTAAAVCDDHDGVGRLVQIEGSDRYPSSVFVTEQGLLSGSGVLSQARLAPHRLVRSPKRRLGEGTNSFAGREISDVELASAVLSVAYREAVRQHNDTQPEQTVLTYPARWAQPRVDTLAAAGRQAGIHEDQPHSRLGAGIDADAFGPGGGQIRDAAGSRQRTSDVGRSGVGGQSD